MAEELLVEHEILLTLAFEAMSTKENGDECSLCAR